MHSLILYLVSQFWYHVPMMELHCTTAGLQFDWFGFSSSLTTYLPTYLPTILPTYQPTYLPTYLPTNLPTYKQITYNPVKLEISIPSSYKVSECSLARIIQPFFRVSFLVPIKREVVKGVAPTYLLIQRQWWSNLIFNNVHFDFTYFKFSSKMQSLQSKRSFTEERFSQTKFI